MKKIILVSTLTGLLFAASANAQDLLVNGDFTNDINSWAVFNGSGTNAEYNSSITDQSGSGGYLRLYAPAADYTSTNVFFGVTQIVNTTINQSDQLTLDFSFTSEGFGVDSTGWSNSTSIDFKIVYYDAIDGTGNIIETDILNIDSTDITNTTFWESSSLNSILNSTTTALSVKVEVAGIANGLTTDNTFMAVDSLTLTAVPEPSTYAMIAGFLAFGFVALRRRMAIK